MTKAGLKPRLTFNQQLVRLAFSPPAQTAGVARPPSVSERELGGMQVGAEAGRELALQLTGELVNSDNLLWEPPMAFTSLLRLGGTAS